MIYISAQPDSFYFLWQLQLQLFNFSRLGIPQTDIHVLIGYDKQMGLTKHFSSFISTNGQAMFYCYPDTRKKRDYDSSLRPHIIAKHFKANSFLQDQHIFYHDSDIIFTELPDFTALLTDEVWYASDTKSYTGYQYLLNTIGEEGFQGMCAKLKVKPSLIKSKDSSSGGAQYLLKRVNEAFWKRLEINCEKVFQYLNDLNNVQARDERKIQAWCTDMWCLWWAAIKLGREVSTTPLLDFAWANTSLQNHRSEMILHYTGNLHISDTKFFRKNNYSRCTPFFCDHTAIDPSSWSKILVDEIKAYVSELKSNRIRLNQVSILIPVRIDSEDRLENLYMVCAYFDHCFEVEIIVLEADILQKVDITTLPANVKYHFIKDESPIFYRTKYINRLLCLSVMEIAIIHDVDAIIPAHQILNAVDLVKHGNAEVCYPYDGNFIGLDLLFKSMFGKTYNVNFFEKNIGKLNIISKRSLGGSIIVKRNTYLSIGGENEYLDNWRPDGVERFKRIKKLGLRTQRVDGNLYHLPHPRSQNSVYNSNELYLVLAEEYFKICRMNKEELLNYVKQWPWKVENQF
ncbi:hypothetical protein DBR43_15305 [Pedobacter sp. KBW06]|uniref:hypothetical protein n=1 Tax=Pedobacter sp. KBW06 TaxID=2153359 RepID=UPI000F9F281E|nr:hypothetical protein [Pedobacter sp. KBW06]RQO69446.1 hypothetical protein DBR43_15305 [Pedobacter sp. KBW06]